MKELNIMQAIIVTGGKQYKAVSYTHLTLPTT